MRSHPNPTNKKNHVCLFVRKHLWVDCSIKVVHSKTFLRSGTVVGSFKIDLKTVYDTTGILDLIID